MIQSNEKFDVVVIGGGPAGATLATLCQRRGYRCLILECASFPRYHIGESLIPHTFDTFHRLGLLEKMRESHFPPKHSVRFISPDGQESQPFYFSETIPGERSRTWQVERSEFDELCLQHARDNGVEVRMQTRVQEVLFEGDLAVGVTAKSGQGETCPIAARVVVDASGRGTVIGSQLGLKTRVPGLSKSSLWAYYKGGLRMPGIDAGETTVFMIPHRGWFWYIPLPDDVVSVGVVAAPEYLFDDQQQFEAVFEREVLRCQPLMKRLADARRVSVVRGIRELAYRNRRIAGNGWLMIGDAAAFLDPIYSSGLFLALSSAELAADCVIDALEKDDPSAQRLGGFVAPLMQGVDVIRRLIHAFYDPSFSFKMFVDKHPNLKAQLIDCLVGDVLNKDMTDFKQKLEAMTPVPPPLEASPA